MICLIFCPFQTICPWSVFLSFLPQVLQPKLLLLACETEAVGFPEMALVAWAVQKWQFSPSPCFLQPGEPWCGLLASLNVTVKMLQRVGVGQVCWWVVMELSCKVYLMGWGKVMEMGSEGTTKSTPRLQKLGFLACLWPVCNVPCAETEHSTSQPETNYLVAAKRISVTELYF